MQRFITDGINRELSEDVEAASETTTDQEDQTKDRESGGEKELTKGTGGVFMQQLNVWGCSKEGGEYRGDGKVKEESRKRRKEGNR
ncbi:zinc finger homeobox protein 3 isoform X2 [Lates japonicus]|uniref:Zinc finger homeobox protein 3 isoform X2 n=1 Tax=Lates japonicus TaxID=270547 RepID=A0AAD3NLP9_LATJO|nr:zinc finger homeobox protein 3 isoform X2 [Lates japonicus]